MLLVQKSPSFQVYFLDNIGQENVFYDILERKKPFQAIKTRSLKSHKIDIFPKGLTPAFGPKMALFPTFFSPQYRPGKSLLRYSRTEKTPFQAIRTGSSKSHKIDIFPKGLTHAFNKKIAIFPIFFLDNIGQENVFYDILERKKPFQAIKTRSLKSHKIDIFPKGLTSAFGPKMAIFPTSFSAIQEKKMSFTIFQNEKTPFQALKTRS